jgi:hypothetical protein
VTSTFSGTFVLIFECAGLKDKNGAFCHREPMIKRPDHPSLEPFPLLMLLFSVLLGAAAVTSVRAASSAFPAGVIATGTQGVTNPPVPTIPTTINQTSMARLLSLNSIDDFCLFAPPSGPDLIGNTEARISLS